MKVCNDVQEESQVLEVYMLKIMNLTYWILFIIFKMSLKKIFNLNG